MTEMDQHIDHGLTKVALLTDGVHPLVLGGMQKHSYHFLLALLAQKIEVLVYHPVSKGMLEEHIPIASRPYLKEVRIDFARSSGISGNYLRRSYAYSARIADNIEAQDGIEFIYAQGFAGWALLDRKRKGASFPPIGVNFHGLEMFQIAKGLKQKVIQWMFKGPVRFNLKHADRVYSLGGNLTRILAEIVPAGRIAEIPIALDEDWILPSPKPFDAGTVRVLFIGRYERRKGIEELSDCIGSSKADGLEYHFVGPIPERKKIRSDKVTYHGKVMDVRALREIIDTCHILVVPSYSEGMPTVILEAMARGLMILATDVGAVSVQVDDENGKLMRPGSIEDIADGLEHLSGLSSQAKQKMSAASIQRVRDNFVWSRVIPLMLDEMSECSRKQGQVC